jgi:hypothetical protein
LESSLVPDALLGHSDALFVGGEVVWVGLVVGCLSVLAIYAGARSRIARWSMPLVLVAYIVLAIVPHALTFYWHYFE